jgi:uncharacterized protein (TIGR02996 family)
MATAKHNGYQPQTTQEAAFAAALCAGAAPDDLIKALRAEPRNTNDLSRTEIDEMCRRVVKALCAGPGDLTHWLVFADFLDERDDPAGVGARAIGEGVRSPLFRSRSLLISMGIAVSASPGRRQITWRWVREDPMIHRDSKPECLPPALYNCLQGGSEFSTMMIPINGSWYNRSEIPCSLNPPMNCGDLWEAGGRQQETRRFYRTRSAALFALLAAHRLAAAAYCGNR